MEGFRRYQAGQLDQAFAISAEVLRDFPNHADAWHLQGIVLQARGQFTQALDCIERALQRAESAALYSNHGMVLRSLGRVADGIASYRKAIRLDARSPLLLLNLGFACFEAERFDECIQACDKVLELEPGNLDALNSRASSHFRKGNLEECERDLKQALAINPLHGKSLLSLGALYLFREDIDASLDANLAATQVAPNSVIGWENLGSTLFRMSRVDEARTAFDRAYSLNHAVENRLRRDLMLPFVPESREQMMRCRAQFEERLEELVRDCAPIGLPTPALYCPSAFLLAFHGENDVGIMRKLARLYEVLCPQISYRAPHVDHPAVHPTRVRIGFFSVNTHEHSVSRCFASLVSLLAADPRFEVVLISIHDPSKSGARNLYAGFPGRIVVAERQYLPAREAIEAQQLDILVYQDIGMDELSYFLAFARLARIQCVLGGHPVTTGIPNIDYFISTELAEPPGARAHYSEQLLLLPRYPVIYRHPLVPERLKTRSELGFPETGAIYLCPMMLQKLHPDFDAAIGGILQRDPEGHVVLFKHFSSPWDEQLGERFNRVITPEVRNRILFLPWLHDYQDFISANAAADVIIDPFHFGIGSTVIATFAVGTPIVTRPGEFMRGRVGLSLCKLMELEECVCHSLEEYVEKATRIANDKPLQNTLRQRILANKTRLFDDERAALDLAMLFTGLAPSVSENDATSG